MIPTDADRERAKSLWAGARADHRGMHSQIEIASALAAERQVGRAAFRGLAEAWEHIAEANQNAAPGSHDDGLRKMAAHAAEAIRRIASASV